MDLSKLRTDYKREALDEAHARAESRRRNRGRAPGVAAAHDEHVIHTHSVAVGHARRSVIYRGSGIAARGSRLGDRGSGVGER